MASQAMVGALRADLSLNSAAFTKGLKDSRSRLSKFGKTVGRGMIAVGATAAAAAAGVALAVRGVLNEADAMAKASQKFGVPVAELSRLKHAADLSGVSFGTLGTGLRKLAQSMQQFAEGANNEATRAFEAMGISATNADGSLKSTSEVLNEVANAMSKMEDGAQKTAFAMAIFGRSGSELIPLLNQGKAGIQAMKDEADALGITISEKTGKAAERFNDNMNRLGKVFSGIATQVAAELAPTLAEFTDWLVANAPTIKDAIVAIVQIIREMILVISDLFARIASDFEALIALPGRVVEAFVRMKDEVLQAVADMVNGIEEWFTGKLNEVVNGISDIGDRITQPFRDVWDAVVGNSYIPDMVRGVEDWLSRLSNTAPGLANDAAKGIDQAFDGMESIGSNIAGTFEQIGSSIAGLIDGTQSWQSVLSSVVKTLGQAIISSNSFQNRFGGSIFGNLLSGLVNSFPGFANGGQFKVGGAGGVDSQLVQFRASPDETVTVSKPGQAMAGGGVVKNTVNVFNNGSSQVSANSRQDGRGNTITDIIVEEVNNGFAQGRFDSSQRSRFGNIPRVKPT